MEPLLYSDHPWGTTFWSLYRGGLYEGYTNCTFGTWIPGHYTEVAFIQGWPLRGVPLRGGWSRLLTNFLCNLQFRKLAEKVAILAKPNGYKQS